MIPAEEVRIMWNLDAKLRVSEMFVCRESGPDCAWMQSMHRYDWGSRFADWMKPGHPDMTPEWIFGDLMARHGFASAEVALDALAEFAKIDSCEWARKMVPR